MPFSVFPSFFDSKSILVNWMWLMFKRGRNQNLTWPRNYSTFGNYGFPDFCSKSLVCRWCNSPGFTETGALWWRNGNRIKFKYSKKNENCVLLLIFQYESIKGSSSASKKGFVESLLNILYDIYVSEATTFLGKSVKSRCS